MVARKNQDLQVINIELKRIKPPEYRARFNFSKEALQELMDSIKLNGLINAITVKKVGRKYEIVAGERRFLAFKKLGRKTIPAFIRDGSVADMEVIKFDENMKRDDLTDLEEANSLNALKNILKLTDAKLAVRVGKSAAYVKQKLAILKYPERLLNALNEGLISFSSARELVRITDERILDEYVGHAVRSGITPSIAKDWADDWLHAQKPQAPEPEEAPDNNTTYAPEEPLLPCHVCGEPKKVIDSRMVRICNDCYGKIFPS